MHSITQNLYYLNNGDASFSKITDDIVSTDLGASYTSILIDYDNDGNLDIFVADQGTMPPSGPCYDQLYHGEGDGSFTKVVSGEIVDDSVHSHGIACADFDNDGDQDLMVLKYNAENVMFENNGGEFTAITGANFLSDVFASGISWGDCDNDGDLDLFVACYQGYNNALYLNNGDGTFLEITGENIVNDGAWSSGSCWGDFDNDGDLDLYVTNYRTGYASPNYLYLNDGQANFTLIEEPNYVNIPGQSGMVASADYDHDGYLDLYHINWSEGEPNVLYRNNGWNNNWLNVKCIGTSSNGSAIGAKIIAYAQINGSSVQQLREITSLTGNGSQNNLNAHFGLGDATIVDTVKVIWPSGVVNVLNDVAINQFIEILEVCGDANDDLGVNVGDAVYIINHVFKGGPAPEPLIAGDANCDGECNVGDAVYLINHVFKGDPGPCSECN
ncbi:MAG: FG-GAP-like repeat-containing protein [candidate division Zixibacteria bacterium]